jgi:hypothetical protein
MIRRAESTEEDPIYTCAMDEDAATLPWLRGAGAWAARGLEASFGESGCMDVACGGGVRKGWRRRSRGRGQAIGGEPIRRWRCRGGKYLISIPR